MSIQNNFITALYIHLPWCKKKCPYCDFNSYAVTNIKFQEEQYVQCLIKNLDEYKERYSNDVKIKTIYFGGGTPSLFKPSNLYNIVNHIYKNFSIDENPEISMEINPGTVSSNKLQDLKSTINRISFGVQSFTDKHLKKLERIHNSEIAIQTIKEAQKVGFTNINIDLMQGLPEQNIDEALFDLSIALQLQVQHISWYQLTIEENTPFYNYDIEIPNEDILETIETKGKDLLKKAGFINYEISAYGYKDFRCNHNLSYWNYNDYLGIGAGAHSKITDWKNKKIYRMYQHDNPIYYMNETNFFNNFTQVEEKNIPFEYFLNKARLYNIFINKKDFEKSTFTNIENIRKELNKAIKLKLITESSQDICLTDLGHKYLNQFLELFL